MHPGKAHPPALHLKFHKEYRLYYWLSILFGTRKQIFLTFAPWVLVTVFNQPVTMLATLLTIGGICGVAFQPLLGKAIDKLGEKTVLITEAVLLIRGLYWLRIFAGLFARTRGLDHREPLFCHGPAFDVR